MRLKSFSRQKQRSMTLRPLYARLLKRWRAILLDLFGITGFALAPAGATLKHMNDAADDPPIVVTFWSGQVSGQVRRNACPLPVIQPKQPCAHRKPPVPNRSARENQNALIKYRP